ncbi:hypothetical protein ACFY4B_26945 [Kitasatospora sp. NPDC001261]|uniref:hypothetical protein n=1 Tax=Kitasatospora sp. NPDC001261 TaxID=3364012 RepID=UPI0036AE834B
MITTDTTTGSLSGPQIDRLRADFELDEDDLDDLVRDVFDERAAAVNNDGVQAQLAFLSAECQDETALRAWLADAFPGRAADTASPPPRHPER